MSAPARFLIGLATGVAGPLVALALLFVGLDRADALKAPSLANRATFDEKLRHFRRHHLAPDPNDGAELLLVGSSTTVHGFDGDSFRTELVEDLDIINAGVQDLKINQSRFLADFFLEHFPGIEQVIMISTTLDFEGCPANQAAFFDPEHAAEYLFGRKPELYFYFKYLDLINVLEKARQVKGWRQADDTLLALSFDRDGSLLLNVPRQNLPEIVWRGHPIVLDPRCYEALRELSLHLRDAGLPFTYVVAPMRPGYLADRDPDGRLLAEHYRRLRESLAGTGAVFIDAHAALAMPEEAFFDAYHLKRRRVPVLTRLIAEAIDGDGEEEAPVVTGVATPPADDAGHATTARGLSAEGSGSGAAEGPASPPPLPLRDHRRDPRSAG